MSNKGLISIIFFFLFFFSTNLFALEKKIAEENKILEVAVGQAQLEVLQVNMEHIQNPNSKILKILKEDLEWYQDLLTVSTKNPEYPYQVKIEDIPSRPNFYKISLFFKKNSLFEQDFFLEPTKRASIHKLSGEIFKVLTKKEEHIFSSQVVLVCSTKTSPGKQIKELFLMDFDGYNFKQLTHHKGIVLAPAFSRGGSKILYTLIDFSKKVKDITLRLLDLDTSEKKVVSKRAGMNFGAVFLPGDQEFLATLNFSGNEEIYRMNLRGEILSPVTKHFAFDGDVSVNKTGSHMAFLSNRSGPAMIYTAKVSETESEVKIVTYVGEFNATPRFSPDGSKIVFSSWLDNAFDLFRIDANGENLSRLTKNFGSNEDPSFSPDGHFIIFASKRPPNSYLYVMNKEGKIIKDFSSMRPLSIPYSHCIGPYWH